VSKLDVLGALIGFGRFACVFGCCVCTILIDFLKKSFL